MLNTLVVVTLEEISSQLELFHMPSCTLKLFLLCIFNVNNEDIFTKLIPQEDITFCAVNKCVFM
jgi:hypothetical protein